MISDETGAKDTKERNGDPGTESDQHEPSHATLVARSGGSWGTSRSSDQEASPLAEALEEYLSALDAGTAPPRDEFLARHSTIAKSLSECLSGLEFIHATGWKLGAARDLGSWPSVDQDLPLRARLGDYRIVREVGRGNMGVVYEAEQVSLGRRVALKVLPFASAIDPRQRQRFLIEAQAAAQLHHPHIVPIFAADSDHGVHFYAMQFVDGKSVAELLTEFRREAAQIDAPCENRGPTLGPSDAHSDHEKPTLMSATVTVTGEPGENGKDAPFHPEGAHSGNGSGSDSAGSLHGSRSHIREIVRLGIQAAEALEHAHGVGIVHRDIKPANLMVDSRGELWITDFGLARVRGDLSLTRSGDLVGTLRYMSPEQALARRGVVDQRTDVYALGLTLYELLTLRPAFDGSDHSELLRQIAQDEPIPLRRVNSSIPRDLETIVMKAICKEPSGRYSTAQELADDLVRFRDDQPILARRPSILESTIRRARRHRQIVVTALTMLVLAVAGGGVALGLQAKRTRQDLRQYINKSFPAIDTITMTAMKQASQPGTGLDEEVRQEEKQMVYQKALDFYEQAALLPPSDFESRKIIARAHHRVGFTHAVMTMAWSKPDRAWRLEQAESHYREAVKQFEGLIAEAPGDLDIRDQYADAVGQWGLGWFFRMTKGPAEAEPFFRQSIALERDLVLDPKVDLSMAAEELVKLTDLVNSMTVDMEATGRRAEAEKLRQENTATVTAVAARLTSRQERKSMAEPMGKYALALLAANDRVHAAAVFRLALILDPKEPRFFNNIAWALVTVPDVPPYDPPQALQMIRKALELEPETWFFWNTLGVAAFRAGDWKTAAESLEKSMSLNKDNKGGVASDWFFLAMTRWRQGQRAEARKWFDQAVEWTKKNSAGDPELLRFQAEAAALLEIADKPLAWKAPQAR
jgi:serine/threonine protein kinase/Flp pilus assembly protein TadD